MPQWIENILLVWSYRPRSLYLLMIGVLAYISIPLMIDWYWATHDLPGQFAALEETISSSQHARIDKRGLFFMFGCWATALKLYLKDRKKVLGF